MPSESVSFKRKIPQSILVYVSSVWERAWKLKMWRVCSVRICMTCKFLSSDWLTATLLHCLFTKISNMRQNLCRYLCLDCVYQTRPCSDMLLATAGLHTTGARVFRTPYAADRQVFGATVSLFATELLLDNLFSSALQYA